MEAIKLDNRFKPLYTSDDRYIYLEGGRGGAKSFTISDYIVRLSMQKGQKILFTRYTLTAAYESIIPEFEEKLELLNVRDWFYVTKKSIVNKMTGVEILFSGIKTSSGNQTAKLKSIPGITTWVYEEFEEHPDEDSFNTIARSIRKKAIRNRIILLSNALPKRSWQYKRFFKGNPSDVTHIYTTYLNNLDNLNEDFIREFEDLRQNRPKEYDKEALGIHYSESKDAVIIKESWMRECVDAHKKLDVEVSGIRKIGYDPADGNEESKSDNNAICYRYGVLITDTHRWNAREDELFKSSQKVYHKSQSFNASHVIYDSIGVGAGVGSNLDQIGHIDHQAFNAGGKVLNPEKEYKPKVKNKDHFSNIKAQMWWNVADRFRNTYAAIRDGKEINADEIISISASCSNLEELIEQVSAPKRDYDNAGRVKVESKQDMDIPSPNLADALIMCFVPQKEYEPLTSSMI